MRIFSKKTTSLVLIIILLVAIFMPTMVRAEDGIGRTKAVVTAKDELVKESTVYVGEIFVDGESQMQWLYSNDLTKTINVYDNLRDAIPNPFASLIPSSVSGEGNGIAVSSSHQNEMNSNWTSASYVANQYYTGVIGTETNSNLYDVNAKYKEKIDAFDATHQNEISNPIAANKRVMSVTSSSVDSGWKMIDGTLTRVDTITFGLEATTIKYTRVDVSTSDTNIIRKTTTNYYTIIDGKLTITGDDNFSKNYKSGDADKKEDYIEGNYTDNAVKSKIDEYSEDMNTIASNYRTTVTIDGEISNYYYDAHDEITQDLETGKVVINTILDKYQVYTLTGTAEIKKITYTLLDDKKENEISFKDYEGIVFVFNSTDILNITDEELQAIADEMEINIEEIKAMGMQAVETATNATKGKGTLVGLYDFSISDGNGLKEEATDGFKIRIKMTDKMKKYNDFSIAFLKDDGNLEESIKLTQNGEYLEGLLPHLSTYVIVGNNVETTPENQTTDKYVEGANTQTTEETTKKTETSSNPTTGDNIIMTVSIFAIATLGAYITLKVNKNRRVRKH